MGSTERETQAGPGVETRASEGRTTSRVGRVEVVRVGGLQENCYLVDDGQGGVVVVDPGDEWDAIRRALAGRPVDVVLVTHFHADHVGALNELVAATGAGWVIGEADAAMLAPGRASTAHRAFPATEIATSPARLLKGGEVVEAGELRFSVIGCPGHSKGGVSYHERACGLVFTGDTLFAGSCGRTDLAGGNGRAIMDSLARLSKLPDHTRVLPGHGPASTIGDECEANPYVLQARGRAARGSDSLK